MEAIALALLSVLVVSALFFFTKGTFLELSLSKGKIWPIFLYRELALVFIPIILVQSLGVKTFPLALFYATDDKTLFIGLFVIYAIFTFSLSLAVFSRIIPISKPLGLEAANIAGSHQFTYTERFAAISTLTGLGLLLLSIAFYGYSHALFTSILNGENLLLVRVANKHSELPSQISQIIRFSSWISAIHCGILIGTNRKAKAIFYFFSSFILSSAGGGKAPIFMGLIIIASSICIIKRPRINLKLLSIYIPFGCAVIFFGAYYVVLLQSPSLNFHDYLFYLVNRIGVGQMSGTYETYSIPRLSGDFYWHMIPFANLFIDYPVYDKQLMSFIENIFDNGVKNSLFISEAFGIGGWTLAILSPIIVGFSYVAGSFFLQKALCLFFNEQVARLYFLPLYILSSSLTGGFSSFALFKGLILSILILGVYWILSPLLRLTIGKQPPMSPNGSTKHTSG